MKNFGNATVTLRAGKDKPAQLLVARITSRLPEAELYGSSADDRFQERDASP